MSPRAAWRLEALGFEQVYEYAAGEADWAASGLPLGGTSASIPRIGDLVRTDVPRARLEETIGDVKKRLAKVWDTAIIVNDRGVVLGRLYANDFESDPANTVAAAMDPGPSTFRPNVTAQEMLEYMREKGLETAPVTTSEGTLLGVLLIEDVEKALLLGD